VYVPLPPALYAFDKLSVAGELTNAKLLKVTPAFSNFTVRRLLQFSKALNPTLVTPLPMVTSVIRVQSSKA